MIIKNNSSTGHALEVDLEYRKKLHDNPLATEKINFPKEWLYKYCLKIVSVYNITTRTVKKLAPILMNKNNYVIHYRNLQKCLELGIKLKKIHRTLKLKPSDWMRTYIGFNTQKRTTSNNEADKNFSKLMNNSVYGKTMENLRKKIKIRVVKNSQDFIKYKSRPTSVIWKVLENNVAAIHEKKISSTLS